MPNEDPLSGVWTVSEATGYIRDIFELDHRLQDMEIEGEISNFTQARSGHLYFTLKDARSQIKCVMWRSQAQRLRFRPQEGDAVVAHGRISIYEASGAYQLYASKLRPVGIGDLAQAFEQLKAKLAAEGLFAVERKQQLPPLPRKIGIVTSADAAALRDILNVLSRRYPIGEVLIAPTLVQGNEAPAQIVQALRWLDGRDDIDLILVSRGGGSIEDLWAFNDERVARAIANAEHPIISGVGHETDFTIADFVADVRAPTPSAAAELATPDFSDMPQTLQIIQQSLTRQITQRIQHHQQTVHELTRALNYLGPNTQLTHHRQQVDMLTAQLETEISRHLERQQNRIALLTTRLQAVSPQETLARGYAIVRTADGTMIRSAEQIQPQQTLHVQVADGSFDVETTAATSREKSNE